MVKDIADLFGYVFGTILKCCSWGVGIGLAMKIAMFILKATP